MQDHARQVATEVVERRVERLRLADRAREAVEQEAVTGIVALDALDDHADDHLVGHELAGIHERLRLHAEFGAVGDRLAQHVAGGDVREVEVLADPLGLRALPGAGRTEQDEVQLRHGYFRKPS